MEIEDMIRASGRQQPELLAFAERTRTLIDSRNDEFPYLDYIAFNLDRDGIRSIKLYVHLFERIDAQVAAQFLPHLRHFAEYYAQWQVSRERDLDHTGCAFALKFNVRTAALTQMFHYRLPPTPMLYRWLDPREARPFDLFDTPHPPGYCFEYRGGEAVAKRYYYLTSQDARSHLKGEFDEADCDRAELIEYTEMDRQKKIILWLRERHSVLEHFQRVGWSSIDRLIAFMGSLGCEPMFPGVYEGGEVRAIYFFRFRDQGIAPFESPENHHIETLRGLPFF